MSASIPLHFFLGAHTPRGYLARIDQLDGCTHDRKIILKGGPGTGKATLISRVAEQVPSDSIEWLHCPASPGSYDGVILTRGARRAVIFDGTPPHTVEPRYPGVVETLLNLGDCLDESLLEPDREAIIALSEREQDLVARVHRFLAAAGSLLGDTTRLALNAVDIEKLERFIDRICHKELSCGSGAGERVRFLTALTRDGVVAAGTSPWDLCEKIYLIDDEHGAVSGLLLAGIRRRALASQYEVITCSCPMAPFGKIDHLLIPEAGIGFMTQNRIHPTFTSDLRHINSRRFMDMDTLGLRRQRVSFNRKAIAELLGESSRLFGEAADTHAALEAFYRHAMDFDRADALIERASTLVDRMLTA